MDTRMVVCQVSSLGLYREDSILGSLDLENNQYE